MAAGFKLTEIKGNIFHTPITFSLAHAVSSEFETPKGSLAWQFAIIFGHLDEQSKQQINSGNVAVLENNSRFIYHLVTKDAAYQTNRYETIEAALICMREHMRNHGINKVAMPRICCNDTSIEWSRIKGMIQYIFAHENNVEILICEYQPMMPKIPKCQINEVKGNIFTAPKNYSLVHSTSADFALCKGINLQFKCKFGQIQELIKQNKHSGNVAVLQENNRFIYNLITKEKNHEKCTYPALYYALVAMREHMRENNVTKLAIPRLGCGIDRLAWIRVKRLLEYVFINDKVEIIAFFYNPPAVVPRRFASMSSLVSRRSYY